MEEITANNMLTNSLLVYLGWFDNIHIPMRLSLPDKKFDKFINGMIPCREIA